jgi:hypothetical protein
MGACEFYLSGRGRTLREAYSDAVDAAETEYGQDSYNGTISTTHNCNDITKEFKASGKQLNSFIENFMRTKVSKRECYAICLEEPFEDKKAKTTKVVNLPSKGTRKWSLVYAIYHRGECIGSYANKAEAIARARVVANQQQRDIQIHVEKRSTTSTLVGEVQYKQPTKNKLGKWRLFGLAAE